MIFRLSLLIFVSLLALTGCQQSQAEKLAYQHAEEQYQLNADAIAKYHRAKADEEEKNKENEEDDEKE